MPRYLTKLADNEYCEWSTVVDAPVTYLLTREQAIEYSIKQHGDTREAAKARISRADEFGHSAYWFGGQTAKELVAGNRAGDEEEELSLEEIRQSYARPQESAP